MYTPVHRATKIKLEQELTTLLAADVEALRIWMGSQQATAAAIAADPDVRRLAAQLVDLDAAGEFDLAVAARVRRVASNSASRCSPCWRRTATKVSCWSIGKAGSWRPTKTR